MTEQTRTDPLEPAGDAAGAARWRELSAQLVELQTQLAFQEDALQALDDVVTSQQQSIDRLLLSQQRLERQLAELGGGTDEAPPADERPPHY
jgi:SlyX protein